MTGRCLVHRLCAVALILATVSCRRSPAPDVLFGVTVRPPADRDEQLNPMPFTIATGATGLRDLVVLCIVDRIVTDTMSLAGNMERAGRFERVEPHTETTVLCDPQVFLDPGRIAVQQATVAIDLEFEADGMSGRQSASFTYEATRHARDGLRWHLTRVTRGPSVGATAG